MSGFFSSSVYNKKRNHLSFPEKNKCHNKTRSITYLVLTETEITFEFTKLSFQHVYNVNNAIQKPYFSLKKDHMEMAYVDLQLSIIQC